MAEATKPLFAPFRALGYITDDVPFAVQRRGKETYVTVSVGKAWQVYNCAKLTLVLVGPQLKQEIRALACKGDLTFAAVGRDIVECKRVHRRAVYRGHTGNIIQLMVIGDFLLSLGADRRLVVWKIGEYTKPQSVVELPAGFIPTCMAHPDTYVNKVVVGSESGAMQLWNFATATLLYTFAGWGSAVRCISSSPALDVVGVGLADGRAALHNLRFDETVTVFGNASGVGLNADLLLPQSGTTSNNSSSALGGGACTAIAFRTGAGIPLMAAGGGAGVVTVWNLEERRLHTVIKDAHDARLLCLHFFAGEPLLMSAAADNSLKHWVFDSADATARLLRFRSGHSAPPTTVMHYGEGLRLLSAGQDRAFRVFSTIQDQQSRELSQKHTAKRAKRLKVREEDLKLARVIAMDAGTVRERDWCNVITAHEGDATAYTWRLQHFTLGDQMLRPPPGSGAAAGTGSQPDAPVTSVALSPCGNFGVVGSAAGRVDRYNMQSGLHRGSYARQAAPGSGALPAHDGAVTGVAVDSCNRLMVTVGYDGMLRIWDFKTMKMVRELPLSSPASRIALHSGSALCAVACDDLTVRMYDIEAGRLVRRFKGHKDRVTSIQISSDCRWCMTASMDGTLRVWDIPQARCLQVMKLGAPVTSLSLSPALDMLATTHINRRGIYLWANQAVFGNPADIVHSEEPLFIGLPTVSAAAIDDAAAGSGKGGKGARNVITIAGQARSGAADGEGDASDDSDASEHERILLEESASSGAEDEDVRSEAGEEVEGGLRASSSSGATESDGEAGASYEQQDPETGAPCPLSPELVTLSLLPRSQWQSLVHLDAIKARNKPIQPPKKPEAAPFFLPSVPTLSGQPTFDPAVAAAAITPAEDGEEEAEGRASGGSKVVRSKGGAAGASGPVSISTFTHLLRAGGEAGDYASFIAHLRGLSAAAIDRELRAMQVLDIESASAEELKDLELLLAAINDQLCRGANFEFCQALLQVALQVHGEAISAHPPLRDATQRLRQRLSPVWGRVDGLLQSVRCMVQFFGNLQG